jgi:hypothetical protein
VKSFTTMSQYLGKRFARKYHGIRNNPCGCRQCHTVRSTLDPFRDGRCSILTSYGMKCTDYISARSPGLPNGVVIKTPPLSPVISLSPQLLPFPQCKVHGTRILVTRNGLIFAAFQSMDVNLDQFLTLSNPAPASQHQIDTGTALQATGDLEWLSFIRSEFNTTPAFGRNQGTHLGYGFHSIFLEGLPWFRFQLSLNMTGRSFGLPK